MEQIRPRSMSQGAFAELLREHGFAACSKTAVSLAERPKESGVQFTQEARKAAQGLLKSTRRAENRVNGNKTTVWLDDETRAWLEKEAYLTDSCVGELIRKILRQAMENDAAKKYKALHWMNPEYNERFLKCVVERKTLADIVSEAIEKAAGAAATAPTVMETGGFGDPSFSDHNTTERRNQA